MLGWDQYRSAAHRHTLRTPLARTALSPSSLHPHAIFHYQAQPLPASNFLSRTSTVPHSFNPALLGCYKNQLIYSLHLQPPPTIF